MTFWKVSDTRMNCLITEAEIAALGYSLEDLTQDRERTEEFLNLLLKKGKEVLGLNTDNGIQGFYGACCRSPARLRILWNPSKKMVLKLPVC